MADTSKLDDYAKSGTKDAAVRDIISVHAYTSALKVGMTSSVICGAAVLAANKYWPTFRHRLGVSGKTALVVSSFLAPFTVALETRIVSGARNPDEYIASMDPEYVSEHLRHGGNLYPHQRLANYVYDHPYKCLSLVGFPLVGGIYLGQRSNKALKASQQIMHTRVYGQGAIVFLLLGSMAFHDYMSRRGRFE